MLVWTIEKLQLNLKFTWKLSRNATDTKINFYIKVKQNNFEGIGEVAPNIRYHETPELILSEFAMMLNNELPIVKNTDQITELLQSFKICQSLKAGILNAYFDLQNKKNQTTPFQYLNIKPIHQTITSFTIPIMDIGELNNFFLQNNLHRFQSIKVKVNQQTALETTKEIHNITDAKIMIDANEDWTDVENLLRYIDKIKNYNIAFIEQPMKAAFMDQYMYLKHQSVIDIFADESIISEPNFAEIKRQFHGVNIKLMKTGGILQAKHLLAEAKLFELKTMIGCMVETTVGIAHAFALASMTDFVDLDSFMYIQNDNSNKIAEENGIIRLVM